jgi:hypothetical protein
MVVPPAGSDLLLGLELPRPPERPPFPPPSLGLSPAFEGPLLLGGEDGHEGDGSQILGPDLLMISAFCDSFADILGLRPPPRAEQIGQVGRLGRPSSV